MRANSGWHRANHQPKHPALKLWRTWVHDNGCEIWQGRPFPERQQHFIYRLVRPDKTTVDCIWLSEAKKRGLGAAADAVARSADSVSK